ncbi:hypothetical protein H3C66_02020 [Patescibacteria group bacterium]|nr:hypothetical protein [Patescibacteria group bacterium]
MAKKRVSASVQTSPEVVMIGVLVFFAVLITAFIMAKRQEKLARMMIPSQPTHTQPTSTP